MRTQNVCLALLVLLAASLGAVHGLAADTDSAALQMVKKLRLGENLRMLGLQTASNTQTYRTIVQTVGAEKARALVTEEMDRARPKYQEQWDRNLAASYSPLFTTEELLSIAEKQKQSPHIQKFLSKQGEVGNSMQSRSSGLLKDCVTEALTNAFHRVAPSK